MDRPAVDKAGNCAGGEDRDPTVVMFKRVRSAIGCWTFGAILISGCGKSCQPFPDRAVRTAQLPIEVLTEDQKALLSTYRSGHSLEKTDPNQVWQAFNLSQQVQFGAGSRALSQACPLPECTESLVEVNGDKGPNAPSQEQFNVWVNWRPQSFEKLKHWPPHIAVLHPGQFGFNEVRDGNPFLGLVVLFDQQPRAGTVRGQFHIGFRSWFAHFRPVNGNISDRDNNACYVDWYGRFDSYEPGSQFAHVDTAANQQRRTSTDIPSDLSQSVESFLRTWYIERDLPAFLSYIADENGFEAQIKSEKLNTRLDALLAGIFYGAFEARTSNAPLPRSLRDAVFFPGAFSLGTAISPESIRTQDRQSLFAIFRPDSLPRRSVLPDRGASDPAASFLYKISRAYETRIVLYVTRPEQGLLEETVVSYWIKERGRWRLAAFRGTDW